MNTSANLQKEIFKPIKSFEFSHMVSNLGRIKSLSRKIPCSNSFRTSKEKILKQKTHKQGYRVIQLKNKGRMLSVHRLVAIAFIPNPENKPQINHINGIKSDNRVENLEWCTQSENQNHAYSIGLQAGSNSNPAKGENQGLSKLTKSDIIWIRENYKKGYGNVFGRKFNVSGTSILNIINYKTWNHV